MSVETFWELSEGTWESRRASQKFAGPSWGLLCFGSNFIDTYLIFTSVWNYKVLNPKHEV